MANPKVVSLLLSAAWDVQELNNALVALRALLTAKTAMEVYRDDHTAQIDELEMLAELQDSVIRDVQNALCKHLYATLGVQVPEDNIPEDYILEAALRHVGVLKEE